MPYQTVYFPFPSIVLLLTEHLQISANKANVHPRLKLVNKGQLYSVQFGDSVALIARGMVTIFDKGSFSCPV